MNGMVLLKATEASEAGVMPTSQLLEDMGRFNEELNATGVPKELGSLKPPRREPASLSPGKTALFAVERSRILPSLQQAFGSGKCNHSMTRLSG